MNRSHSPEAVIGPNGASLWSVTVERPRRMDRAANVTETLHVRAVSESGAILLAQEMVLDFGTAEAVQIT